jgi:site-specific recombinase XerD
MTILEAFNEFIESRELYGLSEDTIICYRSFVTPLITYVGDDTDIQDVTALQVKEYISMIMKRPISKATKATYIRHNKIFLKWLEENYKINLSAAKIRVPKTPKKMLRIYTDDEIATIFNSIYSENEWLTVRNRAIVALMLDSGLRQGEVCTLLRKDVQFSQNIIKILGKGSKERYVPIGKLTTYFLQEYLRLCPYKSEFMFVNRRGMELSRDAVKHMMFKISEQLPFEFSSHKLRHNFATNYCLDQYREKGQVDIFKLMVLLGHEDIETTKRYLHLANQIIASQSSISHIDKLHIS